MIIPVGYGLAAIEFVAAGGSDPFGMVTFGINNSTSLSAQGVADGVADAWSGSGIMANLSSAIATQTVHVKLGPNDDGPFYDRGMSIGGGASASMATSNTAFLVHKATALGGRKGRGRFYLPGVPEADVGPFGNVTAGIVTAINADLATLLTGLDTELVAMVLLHGDATAPTLVTGLQCDGIAATQRRRMR
jgi:hypothetical protein